MNSSLPDLLAELRRNLLTHHFVVVGLDFDGTLVAIQERPETCWITEPQRDLLRSLASHPRVRLAIVTGRELEDIRTRVDIPEIVYAANHGLEIQGGPQEFNIPRGDEIRESLKEITQTLSLELQHITGCWVENKGLTATIHYRSVSEAEVPLVSERVQSVLAPWAEYLVRGGKAVLEIRPKMEWNKYHAVKWISAHAFPESPEHLLLYTGDDVTDQDVFHGFPEALTIQVGDCPSSPARYNIPGPSEIWQFLELLVAELNGQGG